MAYGRPGAHWGDEETG